MKLVTFVLVSLLLWSFVDAQTKTAVFSGLIRDFCGKDQTSPIFCRKHPDFEFAIGSNKGVVANKISADRKPVWSGAGGNTFTTQAAFDQWYRDIPDINMQFNQSITLSNANNADKRILSFNDQHFFPLTGRGFGTQGFKDGNGVEQNFHFTMELHARFAYQGGEIFTFVGDDDLWVYINDFLVIDLGGVHSALSASVTLDTIATQIQIVKGQNYKIDFFYAERHTVQSTCRIDTTLEIFCAFIDRCGVCEGNGDSCPCTCNDNNKCTVDTCDPLGGCKFTPKVCTDNDACTNNFCDAATGECATSPVVCNDGNPCTVDSCNSATGCSFIAKNCNDGKVCTQDSCDGTTGNCLNVPIVCSDANSCTNDTCVEPGGCRFTPFVCPVANPCVIATCSNGNCNQDTSNCNACANVTCVNPDQCTVRSCVKGPAGSNLPGTGVCQDTPVVCNDNNPCTIDTCNGATGCVFTPKPCADDPCNPATCNSQNGQCEVHPVDCNDGNACTVDSCSVVNNAAQCNHDAVVCNDNDPCTVDVCQPPPGINGCVFTALDCNDNSNCTKDYCDPAKGGCVHENLCVGDKCQDSACIASTCFFFDKGCPITTPDGSGIKCWDISCDAKTGCSNPFLRPDRDTVACGFLLLPPGAQAGLLGGGIIAAIVIAGVVFLVVSVIGAKKGYDFWKQRQMKIEGVHTNPLYEAEMIGGENPLYQ